METDKPARSRLMTSSFFLISGIIAATWASRIPEMQLKLNLGNAAWGTVLFASPVGLVCGLLFASWLTSHFGVKKVLIVTSLTSSLLLVLAGFSDERIQLMAALFFLGFSRTIMNISANTLSLSVQKLYPKPIISTFHGLWSLACFVAAGVGSLMIIFEVLPGLHFLIVAIVCILFSLVFSGNTIGEKINNTEKKPFFVRPDRFLGLLGMVAFCGMICENVIFDWSVNYFENAVGAGKGLVTSGYQSFIISMTLGRLLGDRLTGKYGSIRMLMINGVLLTLGFIIVAAFPVLVPAAIGFVIIGIGDSLVVPIVYSLTARSRTISPAYALSAVTLIGYSGFLTGPLLVGILSSWIGMQGTFALIGLFGIAIILLAQKISRSPEMHHH